MEDELPDREAARPEDSPHRRSAATHSLLRKVPAQGEPFSQYMRRALYDPDAGYYASGSGQVGRAGDFFTSVSVGPLFGALLARRFLRWHRESGCRGRWRLVELGAHDGSLARDILDAIAAIDPAACAVLEYRIVEPLERMRARQRVALDMHADRVAWVRDLGGLSADPAPGIVFGNELLDALPFHVIEWKNGGWHECGVARPSEASDSLAWCDLGPVTGTLADKAARIDPSHLPDGYRTEVRTDFTELHQRIAAAVTHGIALWIDYGFARPEYHDAARIHGTLRTYFRHRAGDDPLSAPGCVDITAHVDFTALAEDAAIAGFTLAEFHNQGAWLTHEAGGWMAEMEAAPEMASIRAFQTLTHPAQLGAKFHVIELALGGTIATPRAAMRRCGLSG